MSPDSRLLAGRYQVGELIGRGGMSDVHRGTDSRLGRTVAIKLLKPSLALDPAFRTRFRQEAQAAARMTHPTIVRVFDAGEETVREPNGHEAQLPFIVMEYVDGVLLKDLIKKGPLEVPEAVRITEGILTALEYSHRAGVVHRDIKPGNVMITKTGQVKVMDFGIARAISDSSATVAQTTAVLGTASYFSPEQAKGESVDARTDLYSTGVVLFEMLTGRPPFRGDTPVAIAYQHVSETAVAPSTVNPKISPAMDVVVARALTKDRFERYQTVAEFRADLEEAAAGRVPKRKHEDELAETLFGAPPSSVSGPEAAFRQLAEDQTMTRTQRRPPVIWIWAGIAIMAVVIVAVLAWVLRLAPSTTMPDSSRKVPNLSGQVLEKATTQLDDMKLKWVQTPESSPTYAQGQVIRTDPGAGIVVATGDTITVYVSTGKKTVTVPDVHNMTVDAASQALQQAGFTVGPTTSENSPSVPANVVISTDPGPNASAHEGDPIGLHVSSGKVTLTDLTGQTIQAATGILSQLGLTANPKPDPSCPQDKGATMVHTQSVSPGDVPQGTAVDLTYCSG